MGYGEVPESYRSTLPISSGTSGRAGTSGYSMSPHAGTSGYSMSPHNVSKGNYYRNVIITFVLAFIVDHFIFNGIFRYNMKIWIDRFRSKIKYVKKEKENGE